MENIVSFELEDNQSINFDDYDNDEFAIAKMGYLSSRPNSHGLEISDDVLKECASTALGKWVVAKLNFSKSDMEGHEPSEQIMGIIPKDQEVEFVEEDDGYIRAYANVVISKIYAKDFCSILSRDTTHSVSVEMSVLTENGKGLNDVVESFNIVGVTVLGTTVKPSCPDSNIEFIRFAENAESYFEKKHLTALQKFAQNRKAQMEEKKYKIDKSKESLSDKAWGDVDKTAMRNKIMEASNRASLVKSVYLLVEDGWEDAPSEHLKFPVMELKDDTFVYNRGGLSSALGYAEKENETSVVNKIKKIYKNLGIDNEGKEGESKMSEIEFAAVDIGDMWGKLWDALHAKYPDGDYSSVYYIENIYEDGNQKFAIIRKKDEDNMYRLDFTLTEDGLTLADEITKVEVEVVETDEIRKFAEPEDVEKYRTFAEDEKKEEEDEKKAEEPEEKDTKLEEKEEEAKENPEDNEGEEGKEEKAEMSCEEMMAKIAQLEADITDRDNIIMEKDTELAELRTYKEANMEAQKAAKVETIMSQVEKYMDKETATNYRSKGMECEFSALDSWANEVKASIVDKVVNSHENKEEEFTRMSSVTEPEKESGTALERLKAKFCK